MCILCDVNIKLCRGSGCGSRLQPMHLCAVCPCRILPTSVKRLLSATTLVEFQGPLSVGDASGIMGVKMLFNGCDIAPAGLNRQYSSSCVRSLHVMPRALLGFFAQADARAARRLFSSPPLGHTLESDYNWRACRTMQNPCRISSIFTYQGVIRFISS